MTTCCTGMPFKAVTVMFTALFVFRLSWVTGDDTGYSCDEHRVQLLVMMALCPIPGCRAMSDLLTVREKGVLVTLLQPQSKLIKTTVAQVLVAKQSQGEGRGWSMLACGALCLVEDECVRSHFLRLYCVKRAMLLWEEELYVPFKYTATRKFFHTFPADGHQAGLNFANETEAEEFHLAVAAVQRSQDEMTRMVPITNGEGEDGPTRDPTPDSGLEAPDHLDELPCGNMDALSMTVTPVSSFKGLDPQMRRLFMRANLTEKDLRDKDMAEAVDCIIKQHGGLKAVQRELRNTGPVSQTLNRSAGASVSLALRKGPLPPIPTPQQTPKSGGLGHDISPFDIPPPPSTPAPILTERMRKSASFKHVGSTAAAGKGDLILTALREVSRHK